MLLKLFGVIWGIFGGFFGNFAVLGVWVFCAGFGFGCDLIVELGWFNFDGLIALLRGFGLVFWFCG